MDVIKFLKENYSNLNNLLGGVKTVIVKNKYDDYNRQLADITSNGVDNLLVNTQKKDEANRFNLGNNKNSFMQTPDFSAEPTGQITHVRDFDMLNNPNLTKTKEYMDYNRQREDNLSDPKYINFYDYLNHQGKAGQFSFQNNILPTTVPIKELFNESSNPNVDKDKLLTLVNQKIARTNFAYDNFVKNMYSDLSNTGQLGTIYANNMATNILKDKLPYYTPKGPRAPYMKLLVADNNIYVYDNNNPQSTLRKITDNERNMYLSDQNVYTKPHPETGTPTNYIYNPNTREEIEVPFVKQEKIQPKGININFGNGNKKQYIPVEFYGTAAKFNSYGNMHGFNKMDTDINNDVVKMGNWIKDNYPIEEGRQIWQDLGMNPNVHGIDSYYKDLNK